MTDAVIVPRLETCDRHADEKARGFPGEGAAQRRGSTTGPRAHQHRVHSDERTDGLRARDGLALDCRPPTTRPLRRAAEADRMEMSFDPASAEYAAQMQAADRAVDGVLERRLATMRDGARRVCAPNVSSAQIAARFAVSELPADGCAPDAYLAALEARGLHDEMLIQSPHMLGHMSGAITPWAAPLGRLVHAMHANVVKTETAKVATAVERETVAMLHREFFREGGDFYAKYAHEPRACLGHATSGGTTANLEALWLARNLALPSAEARGIGSALRDGGWSEGVIVTSRLAHYSVTAKACGVLGIGTDNVLRVRTDARMRIDLADLRATLIRCAARHLKVLAIVAVAGSTECGSFDPLTECAALAREFGTWLHVDAAWGGGLIFGPAVRATLLRGIELADSITVDAHKQLLTPIGLGIVLYRSPTAALATAKSASYIIRPDSHDLGRYTLEGSRPASAYFLHMNLLVLGARMLGQLVDRKLRVSRALAHAIERAPDFELLVAPEADILLFRHVPAGLAAGLTAPSASAAREAAENALDDVQRRVQDALKDAGRTFLSRTALLDPRVERAGGTPTVFLRAVVNVQSSQADALAVLDDVRRTHALLPRAEPADAPYRARSVAEQAGAADSRRAPPLKDAEAASERRCAQGDVSCAHERCPAAEGAQPEALDTRRRRLADALPASASLVRSPPAMEAPLVMVAGIMVAL